MGTDLDREGKPQAQGKQAGLWLGRPPRDSIPTVPTCLLEGDKKLHRLTLSSSYFSLSIEDTSTVFLLPLYVWTENSCQHTAAQFQTRSTSQRGSGHASCAVRESTHFSLPPESCSGSSAAGELRKRVLPGTAYSPCGLCNSAGPLTNQWEGQMIARACMEGQAVQRLQTLKGETGEGVATSMMEREAKESCVEC